MGGTLNDGRLAYTVRPDELVLWPNAPNPFNSGTALQVGLPEAGRLEMSIYNVNGQKVATLFAEERGPGFLVLDWDGRTDSGTTAGSGVYIARLLFVTESGETMSRSEKMLLVR